MITCDKCGVEIESVFDINQLVEEFESLRVCDSCCRQVEKAMNHHFALSGKYRKRITARWFAKWRGGKRKRGRFLTWWR